MAGSSAKATALRGLINSGWKRGGFIRRQRKKHSTWAPKAIALNEHLHPTTESRSIIIRMDRKLPGLKLPEVKEPKAGDDKNEFVVLRRKCARWAKDNLDALRDAEPEIPEQLIDRTKQNWTPLLAIAEACQRPKGARKAVVAITGQKLKETPLREQLLHDLAELFEQEGSPLLSTYIVAKLTAMEARPWGSMPTMRGAALTMASLASMLKYFLIEPGEIKTFSGRRGNGYRREQFTELFERYVPK